MPEERVVIVAVVSREEQARADLPSLDEQERACRDYCRRVGDVIVDVIRIEGHSRSYSRLDRLCQDSEDYAHLVDLMEAGTVTKVVVENYHRLWRRAALQAQLCALADELDVWLFSLGQPTERGGEQSAMWLRTVYGLNAEQEIIDLAHKHRRGMRGRVRKGLPICSTRRPYAYRVEGRGRERTVIPVPEERRGLLFIMEHRAMGWGYGRIGLAAYEEGWHNPNRPDGRWTDRAVSYICHNPLYAGFVRFSPDPGHRKRSRQQSGKARKRKEAPEIVKGHHEALISEELWQRVQRVNGSHAREYTHGGAPHLFTGLCRCGHCGDGMAFRNRHGRNNLCCARYQRHGGPKSERRPDSCQYNGHSVDRLREDVIDWLRQALDDPDAWARAAEQPDRGEERQQHIADLERELGAIDLRRRNLLEEIETASSRERRSDFVARYDALGEQRNRCVAELDRLHQAGEWIEGTRARLVTWQEAAAGMDSWSDAELRARLVQLIDRIVLRQGEPPVIVLGGEQIRIGG